LLIIYNESYTFDSVRSNALEAVRFDRERRKQPRLSVSLPLEYRKIHGPRLRTGIIINLSDQGLLFHCRGDMNVGTRLTISVMFADECKLTSFDVCVKIIWKDLHFERDWNEYEYGAEFIQISEDAKEKLNRLLTAMPIQLVLK
jgi:hypothetical protein